MNEVNQFAQQADETSEFFEFMSFVVSSRERVLRERTRKENIADVRRETRCEASIRSKRDSEHVSEFRKRANSEADRERVRAWLRARSLSKASALVVRSDERVLSELWR